MDPWFQTKPPVFTYNTGSHLLLPLILLRQTPKALNAPITLIVAHHNHHYRAHSHIHNSRRRRPIPPIRMQTNRLISQASTPAVALSCWTEKCSPPQKKRKKWTAIETALINQTTPQTREPPANRNRSRAISRVVWRCRVGGGCATKSLIGKLVVSSLSPKWLTCVGPSERARGGWDFYLIINEKKVTCEVIQINGLTQFWKIA